MLALYIIIGLYYTFGITYFLYKDYIDIKNKSKDNNLNSNNSNNDNNGNNRSSTKLLFDNTDVYTRLIEQED
jgi:hypothetical protein